MRYWKPLLVFVAVAALVVLYQKPWHRAPIAVPTLLDCVTPTQFDAQMSRRQALHDARGEAVVQLASITPAAQLAGWKNPTDYDSTPHGQLVAFICATESYAKLGLQAGRDGNELWLRHSGQGDTRDHWTAYIHAIGSTDFRELAVFKRDTADDATLHPPGHAQWVDGDENIWVSCAKGCCYVGGGSAGDTTKHQ